MRRSPTLYAGLVLVLGLTLLPRSVKADVIEAPGHNAITVSGVPFRKDLTVQGARMRLMGAGLLRYRVVFKGYAAALYVGIGGTPARVFEDIPKRLEIEYFHAISAKDFRNATREGLKRNVPTRELSALEPRVARLDAVYRDVKPKDRYAFTYVPGAGSTLTLNDRPLGVFQGLDFANAFLSIWIGPSPLSEELKKQLLAGQ